MAPPDQNISKWNAAMVTTLVSYCDNHWLDVGGTDCRGEAACCFAHSDKELRSLPRVSWDFARKGSGFDLVWPTFSCCILDQGNMPQRGILTLWFRLGSQFCGLPANPWCSWPSLDLLRSKGQQNTDTQSTRSAARSKSLNDLLKKVLCRCFYIFYVLCDDPQKDHSWSSWKTYEACTGTWKKRAILWCKTTGTLNGGCFQVTWYQDKPSDPKAFRRGSPSWGQGLPSKTRFCAFYPQVA